MWIFFLLNVYLNVCGKIFIFVNVGTDVLTHKDEIDILIIILFYNYISLWFQENYII